MLNDLLWLWDAKLQYERTKAQGLAGLVGILSVIFIVWKWEEWFYPLFEKFGLVRFAERADLVHEDPIFTVIHIVFIIFIISLFFSLIIFGIVVFGMLLIVIGGSKAGQSLIMIALFPLFFILSFGIKRKQRVASLEGYYQQNPELRELLNTYKDLEVSDRNLQLYVEQLKSQDEDTVITRWDSFEDAKRYLHRAIPSVKDNTQWLIGYNRAWKKTYILFPNPLPTATSRSFDEMKYKESNVYDFIGQYISAYSNTGYAVKIPGYFVPALEISFNWEDEGLRLNVSSPKLESVNIRDLSYTFHIKSIEYNNTIKEIYEHSTNVHNAIKQAHVAYYVIPIAYRNFDRLDYDETKYFLEHDSVPNTEAVRPIYEADVQRVTIEHAKNGEKWAIEWFKKVE